MNIYGLKRYVALLMISLFLGALGACDEQGSTEQTSETTSENDATTN